MPLLVFFIGMMLIAVNAYTNRMHWKERDEAIVQKEIREEQWQAYKKLWEVFLTQNPDLVQELKTKASGKILTDMFANTDINQARAISEILNEISTELTEETLPSISEISNKELSLQMSVGDYMKTLTKEQRELLRELMDNKTIEFRCK